MSGYTLWLSAKDAGMEPDKSFSQPWLCQSDIQVRFRPGRWRHNAKVWEPTSNLRGMGSSDHTRRRGRLARRAYQDPDEEASGCVRAYW